MPDRITMTPARQAVYHLGCAARHVWRAVVAFFPVAILMTLLLIVGLFIFALSSGCTHKPAPVISDAPPSERPAASMVSAAVTTARAENAKTVAGPSREAIELLLRVALSGLPLPTPADLARMAALASLAHDGKLTEANEKAAAYEHELRTLRENVAKERAESAARIEALIANHQRELDHAAYMAVVWVFCGIGACCTIAGILVAWWSTYKIGGYLLIAGGPLLAGSGLLWGKPWFYIPAGLAILLVGMTAGIKVVWAVLDRDKNGKVDLFEARELN